MARIKVYTNNREAVGDMRSMQGLEPPVNAHIVETQSLPVFLVSDSPPKPRRWETTEEGPWYVLISHYDVLVP